MIKPENIISKGWDSYEDNQIDYYYIECMQAGNTEYYPDEFYDLEDPRIYPEYYG